MDILTNKSTKSSNYFSRYNGRAFYYNKKTKKDQLATSSWLKHTNDYSTYIVKEKDTYDSIALEYYNNPTYYWIICDFNRILDPLKKPEVGTTLYLPTLGANFTYEEY